MKTHSDVRVTINGENLYGDLIRGFLVGQFPAAIHTDKATKLDLVTAALIGSGQVRQGPQPNPESLVAIREVVRQAIDSDAPIPVLTPWGSKKPRNGASVDIAEIGALKQLACLQSRVQQHHAPGLQMRIRIEDASGYYLFADEEEDCRPSIDRYSADLGKLIRVLGLRFIHPVLESAMFDEHHFAQRADEIVPLLKAYIEETDAFGFDGWQERESWRLLRIRGFQGGIPQEQRTYYRSLYQKLVPGISPEKATYKLSRYLANALIRIKLDGRGDDVSWGGKYLQVTFTPPVPGAPMGLVSRFIYYRTLPTSWGRTHVQPWRAKGYLKMHGREATPKIVSWNDIHEDTVPCSVELTNDDETVSVSADYLVTD